MHRTQRTLQGTLTWLVLGLAMPAWAQTARVDGVGQRQPTAFLQVTQTQTVAVCGDTCDCGDTGVAKESAPAPSVVHGELYQSAAGNVVCVPRPIPSRCVGTPVTAARVRAHQSLRPLRRDIVGRPVQYRQRGVLCVHHRLSVLALTGEGAW